MGLSENNYTFHPKNRGVHTITLGVETFSVKTVLYLQGNLYSKIQIDFTKTYY